MDARRLTLLRIDDGLWRSRADSDTTPKRDLPPSNINLYESDVFDWESALTLWVNYGERRAPDLVIADVHFDRDGSSPLAASSIVRGNHLPTGISHLKPFAALSRPVGALIGVGLHTADHELWERLCNSSDPTERCMGYLAAHEIGELAAILGEHEVVEQIKGKNSVQPVWDWIKINSGGNPKEAFRIALRNYRRRLLELTDLSRDAELFVLPDDLAQMLNWCSQMQRSPQPLTERNDCPLTLTRKDGKQDSISLASLFGDCEQLAQVTLDPECFIPPSKTTRNITREMLCRLDHNGNPRIGPFIASLGMLNQVYYEAIGQVSHFPFLPSQIQSKSENLRVLVPENGVGLLVRGLVVLFQLLRIEQARFESWADLFENAHWNPRKLSFSIAEPSPPDSLRVALERLSNLIRFHKGTEFGRADVFDPDVDVIQGGEIEWVTNVSDKEVDEPWIRWHFDRLIDAGVIARAVKDDYVMCRSGRYLEVPPIPAIFEAAGDHSNLELSLPDQKDPLPNGCAPLTKSWKGWLRDSLGFASDDAALGQVLCDAFIRKGATNANQRRIRGNEFLAQCKAGGGPPWVMSLCQKYVTEHLEWTNQDTWPRWLKISWL